LGCGTSGELGLASDLTVALVCPRDSVDKLKTALTEILAPSR
jgi:hypothetical protein